MHTDCLFVTQSLAFPPPRPSKEEKINKGHAVCRCRPSHLSRKPYRVGEISQGGKDKGLTTN